MRHVGMLILALTILGGCAFQNTVKDVVESVDQPVKSISGDFKKKEFKVEYYEQETE